MTSPHEFLGVIPARGGSKRIPGKNMTVLGGKPLLQWTFDAARPSRLHRVVVTTDDDAIATYATHEGMEVHHRDPTLGADDVHAVWTVLEVLRALFAAEGYLPTAVMMLQPTSPFRTTDHINEALALWQQKTCDAVLSVCPVEAHYQTLQRLDSEGYLLPVGGHGRNTQGHEPVWRINGAIFLASERALLKHRSFHVPYAVPYVMSAEAALEIDTPADLKRARRMVKGVAYA